MTGSADIGDDRAVQVAARRSAAFNALLHRLRGDDDPGIAYERLRLRLIRYFRMHVPAEADELADVAIDRLARRVDEGVEIVDVPLYALGIARLVLLEARARHARRQRAEADPTGWPDDDPDSAESRALDERATSALTACLDEAGGAARTMIIAYYTADGGERIRARQHLAEQSGISLNALRNRAQRLRDALERCVRTRLQPEPKA